MAGIPEVPRKTDLRSRRDKLMTMDDIAMEEKVKQGLQRWATIIDALGRQSLDSLIVWAEMLDVPVTCGQWLDDEWYDRQDEFVSQIATALEEMLK